MHTTAWVRDRAEPLLSPMVSDDHGGVKRIASRRTFARNRTALDLHRISEEEPDGHTMRFSGIAGATARPAPDSDRFRPPAHHANRIGNSSRKGPPVR